MIAHKSEFARGALLILAFVVVLILMFLPLMDGKNALEYSDDLYNSISKKSAYYIPAAKKEVESTELQPVELTLEVDAAQAEQTALLFNTAGAAATALNGTISIRGDLGKILTACLADSDAMFANNGQAVSEKYGYDARQALYNWWTACKAMDKDLGKQKLFKEATVVDFVKKKAVEPAYNYYGIEPQRLTERLGVVTFSLIFYVVYTLWYGFGIMFMLEGWGMRLEH